MYYQAMLWLGLAMVHFVSLSFQYNPLRDVRNLYDDRLRMVMQIKVNGLAKTQLLNYETQDQATPDQSVPLSYGGSCGNTNRVSMHYDWSRADSVLRRAEKNAAANFSPPLLRTPATADFAKVSFDEKRTHHWMSGDCPNRVFNSFV
ncbi:hypothetical protein K438DRAFT_1934073 [Mycena galopus ATCC 62051]|nr:hypothetical protein K438DRAFT_1934073 [Mycena galopus ATCC 62051]